MDNSVYGMKVMVFHMIEIRPSVKVELRPREEMNNNVVGTR